MHSIHLTRCIWQTFQWHANIHDLQIMCKKTKCNWCEKEKWYSVNHIKLVHSWDQLWKLTLHQWKLKWIRSTVSHKTVSYKVSWKSIWQHFLSQYTWANRWVDSDYNRCSAGMWIHLKDRNKTLNQISHVALVIAMSSEVFLFAHENVKAVIIIVIEKCVVSPVWTECVRCHTNLGVDM